MEGVQTNPIVIVVTVTIDAAREAEFLAAMTVDAVGSRKEPGCRQFDVIKVVRRPLPPNFVSFILKVTRGH